MIAVHTAIACGAEAVLYPESQNDSFEALVGLLRAGWERGKRSSIVVVAEGDQLGNAYTVGERLRQDYHLDLRVVVLGHIQRGGSPTALDRIYGSRWGAEAVRRLVEGESAFYMGVKRNQLVAIPLAQVQDPKPEPLAELAGLVNVLSR